ncbi:MAG: TlpA family protein disulfide reductase [Saprospirales bacterium]|nr:MAG: TlpA family protein disulfide reductase [Saprospirales bacterium]
MTYINKHITKFLRWIPLALVSIALFYALSYIRAFDFRWNFIAAAVYGVAIYYFVRWKYQSYMVPLLILLIPHILVLGVAICLFLLSERFTTLAFPGLIAVPMGVVIPHLLRSRPEWTKGLVYSGFTVFCLWVAFSFIPKLVHLEAFGTITGVVESFEIRESQLVREDSTEFSFSDDGKIYLLDFWFSRCPVCFREFPILQEVYDISLNTTNFEVLAVNSPLKNEIYEELIDLLQSRDFSFPTLFYVGSQEDLYSHYGVRGFPSYVIVQDKKVVFIGSLSNAKSWLRENGVDL